MSRTGGRLALGCITAVSLPFIIGGAVTIKEGIGSLGRDPAAWILIMVGSLFAGVGVLMIAGASYGMRHQAHELTMREQNPDQPWLWRDDWALGYARETGGAAGVIVLWIFAILWNAICFPLVLVFRRELEQGNTKILFAAIFPAVGLLVVILAVVLTFRQRRFRKTLCHFQGLPLAIGHSLRGDVELHSDIQPENGFVFRLACVHAVTTGSGKSSSTTETIEWDSEQVVSASAAMRNPMATHVPFEFVTPPDAPTTDTRNMRDRTFWRLSIYADVPGVDLDTSFQLPLFAVGPPPENREFVSYAEERRSAAASRMLDRRSGVTINEMPDGEEIKVAAQPTFGGFIASLLFLSIWNGVIYLMWRFHAPVFFPIIFGIFDLFIFLGFLDYLFGRTMIRVNREGVRSRRTIFGIGSTLHVPATDIASISGRTDGQNQTAAITLKRADGKTSELARFLRSRSDADTVAARIELALFGTRRAQ